MISTLWNSAISKRHVRFGGDIIKWTDNLRILKGHGFRTGEDILMKRITVNVIENLQNNECNWSPNFLVRWRWYKF